MKRTPPKSSPGGTQAAAPQPLGALRDVVATVRGRPLPAPAFHADAHLERDLGLDSLARMELFSRLEERFGVKIGTARAARIETVRELLEALAQPDAPAGETFRGSLELPEPSACAAPPSAQTLIEVLDWHARHQGERLHLRVLADDTAAIDVTYARLWNGARRVASQLVMRGVRPGSAVALMLPTAVEYFPVFFGAMLAGGFAVPLYPPVRSSQIEEHLRRQRSILRNCEARVLVASPEVRRAALWLRDAVPSLELLTDPRTLLQDAPEAGLPAPPRADDLAMLQYTSGSTGEPKGVELTHRNLLANIRAMAASVGASPSDVMVSWLPLYHDMGLIGAWFGSLCQAVPFVVMSPLAFLGRPSRWLWAIHHHRGTLSAGPNFAFELCLRRVTDGEIEGLDLSSLRMLFNGAEPVLPSTLERFHARFARYGLRREALAPVYGLAECCVGLSFPPPGRGPVLDRVRRESLERHGRAEPAPEDTPRAAVFVGCGRPLPGHEIRIVDGRGREVPERTEGRIQFRGPSCTRGYYRNPEATRALFDGAWLESGDRGYVAGGELFVTGRAKDLVIRAGRNIHPQEIEDVVGELPGLRKGCVVAFGVLDEAEGTEKLVVVAETRETDPVALEGLREAVARAVAARLELPPDEVVLVPPHSVLKTSSGKLRRDATRRLYLEGTLGRARSVRAQLLRLALASAGSGLRRRLREAAATAWGLWAWGWFGVLALPVGLSAFLVPTERARRRVLRAAFAAFRAVTGLRVALSCPNRPPDSSRPCVFVANHASYADGIVLAGMLPWPFAFVAKTELRDAPFVGRMLERIGTIFVERRGNDAARAREEAVAALRQGRSLLFFPEGTFDRAPELLPFRMGAFLAAAEVGVPVVPVAVRGTRDLLRAYDWLLRRTPIAVTVGPPLEPAGGGDTWSRALQLRDCARAWIASQ